MASDDAPLPPHSGRPQALLRGAMGVDPLWWTRWFVLLLLLLDSLRYGVLDGTAPPQVLPGLLVIAAAAVVNLVLLRHGRRELDAAGQQWVGRWSLAVDGVLVTTFVLLYSFAPASGHHLLLLLLVVEGATVLGWVGTLGAWVLGVVIWVTTQVVGNRVFDLPLQPERVIYPLIGAAIVAMAAGLLAERVQRQQALLAAAVEARERELAWRRALIDMLAHDLRAPMATAATSAELLATRFDDLPREQISALADTARRQIRRALRLLDDLLDLGRARAGALEVQHQEVPLDAFVAEILEELPARVADGVTLELAAGPAVVAEADHSRLAQVLWNLLTNAHKHGAPPVTVRLADGGHGTVLLEVEDCGPGVPEAMLATMYEPFSSGGDNGSTGLGLWISQLLVAAMGGELTYVREEGRSSFLVRLPAAPRPSDAGAGTA